jgi:branched-chain amino acid transport system permease protein
MPIVLVVVGLALLPLGLTSNTVLNFLAFAMIITLAAQG